MLTVSCSVINLESTLNFQMNFQMNGFSNLPVGPAMKYYIDIILSVYCQREASEEAISFDCKFYDILVCFECKYGF